MDLVKDLVIKVKEEFKDCIIQYNANIENAEDHITLVDLTSFLDWMIIEYRNYILLARASAEETLHKFVAIYPTYKIFIDCLLSNINEYGSMQGFYRVALELTEENNVTNI